MKKFDRAYFQRWYHSGRRVIDPASRRRRVRHALSAAEYVLEREVRTVLDVGCGEAPWRAELRRMRPNVEYVGVDSSEYVVERYGRARNIVPGSLGMLGRMGFMERFDLVVCSDVLQYVTDAEMRSGLQAIARLVDGLAYIETYPDAEEFIGDFDGWQHRSESAYRSAFALAGLHNCGLGCWVTVHRLGHLGPLETI